MSYCRWSTDSFRCDLYCYEDVNGGWRTHVAGNKPVGDDMPVEPEWPTDLSHEDMEKWLQDVWLPAHQKLMTWLETCEREDITLLHAGETFNDDTLEEFRDRLTYLRGLGYRFPDSVLEMVNEEIKNAAVGTE